MKLLLSVSIAVAGTLLLAPSVWADDLVLEVTTKLGAEKTVIVAKVNTGEEIDATANRQTFGVPSRLFKGDKKYLALTTPLVPKRRNTISHPGLLIVIPWPTIKEITLEKGISTVTCVDGVKFTGTILTEVANSDGQKYHLGDCTKVVVKKVTKGEPLEAGATAAKCLVRFDNLEQSFEARSIRFNNNSGASEKFQMKVGGDTTAGNLSDFEKIMFKGSGTLPIAIGLQAPKGIPVEGELVTIGNANLVFETNNGSVLVVSLRDAFSAREATFDIAIEATKAGERLPAELFVPRMRKK